MQVTFRSDFPHTREVRSFNTEPTMDSFVGFVLSSSSSDVPVCFIVFVFDKWRETNKVQMLTGTPRTNTVDKSSMIQSQYDSYNFETLEVLLESFFVLF